MAPSALAVTLAGSNSRDRDPLRPIIGLARIAQVSPGSTHREHATIERMLRVIVSIAFLAAAIFLILADFIFGLSEKLGDLFLNLGSEMIGIAATVAIVEWLFERRDKEDSNRKIALRVLHEIDHAVWVWQGGARTFNVEELRTLLLNVGDTDSFPPFTETLFLRIGSKAANTIRESEAVQATRPLRDALSTIALLAEIRDWNQANRNGSLVRPSLKVAQCILEALPVLCSFANETWASEGNTDELCPAPYSDASEKAQEWRHFGTTQNGPLNR